ncbi:MAG: hypothetical protein JWP11_1308 [Frankiales bacterium]|nr:hypothetical protein [Frankiales bacterium]
MTAPNLPSVRKETYRPIPEEVREEVLRQVADYFMRRDGATYVVDAVLCFRQTGSWPND